jgi:hypothetical protein
MTILHRLRSPCAYSIERGLQIAWLRKNPLHGEGPLHQPLLAVSVLASLVAAQELHPVQKGNMLEELNGMLS